MRNDVFRKTFISIHALREEGDAYAFDIGIINTAISIHALREEGDTLSGFRCRTLQHFYPRPPRGGRLK